MALLAAGVFAADKKRHAPEAYGLVRVSVFHEPGIALPGAEVTLSPSPEAGEEPAQSPKLKGATDARGEYAFRVPALPRKYKVQAASRGFRPEEKTVSIQGEDHIDVTLVLSPESK